VSPNDKTAGEGRDEIRFGEANPGKSHAAHDRLLDFLRKHDDDRGRASSENSVQPSSLQNTEWKNSAIDADEMGIMTADVRSGYPQVYI
jgi:hypothetical protein